MPGAERLAQLDTLQAGGAAGGKRALQRQGSSRKRSGSAGLGDADAGSHSDGEYPNAVAAAQVHSVAVLGHHSVSMQ